MTIREIIQTLKQEGMQVSFYVRKDGGVRITKINGQSFTGSKGNVFARQVVGVSLSEAQARALKKLKTPKGKGNYNKRRKTPIDEETRSRIKRIQALYRKRGYSGKPTIRGYRWNLKTYGKKEADRLLRQSELYAQGIVYQANVEYLIQRIRFLANSDRLSKFKSALERIIQRLEGMKTSMRYDPTYLKLIDDKGPIYELEVGRIEPRDAINEINSILDKN